jgi:hypothetical protein
MTTPDEDFEWDRELRKAQEREARIGRIYGYTIAAYILVAIISFGHAYNNVELSNAKARDDEPLFRSLSGLMCGGLWPLYWSVHMFYQPKLEK